jgi:amino acid adenylation domain-containing protein
MGATSDHSKRPSRSFASQGGSPEERLLAALVSISRTAVLPREADKSPLPLSFAQERLWFLDQWEPGSPVYNIYYAYRLLGRLNMTALEESLNEIVRRHEVLRTTFVAQEGRPYQVIAPRLRVALPVVELGGLPEAEREAEVDRLAREEAGRPFDLAGGPLIRTTLLRLGEREHVLLLAVHHIVFDGWSVGIFWRELGALYEAYSRGEPLPLAELAIQYADYALWQREWLQGEVLEEQLGYWREQLAGVPPSLDLPTDRARPAVQSYRGAEQRLELGGALCAGLKALSRGEGVTLFMTLLAAYQVLLHRCTGQDDVVVGSGIANRNRVEIEGLIGFFVNTLVLRSVLSGNPTFRELLARVRDVCLGAYDHQDIPFERLVAELQPERDPSRAPLFQAAFQVQNYPLAAWELGEVRVQPLEVEGGTAKFDVSLSMEEMGDRLLARLRYNCDLFDAGTMERMLGHYRTLLEGIVADADERVRKLPLLTEAERRQMVVEWNDTGKRERSERCVHEIFEEQAKRTPDAVAVVCEDQQLTYRQLNERANRLANHLAELGVRQETPVAICVQRSLALAVGLLGILKAGGAYVPLELDHPAERLAYMLADADASLLLTEARLAETLPAFNGHIVCLDVDCEAVAHESRETPVSRAGPQNLACVLYTSGSTGVPKGVMIGHGAISNFVSWVETIVALSHTDSVLWNARAGFDGTITELFAPLAAGARVIVRPEQVHPGSEEVVQLIARHKVTVLNVVPSVLQILLADERFTTCSDVRVVFCGGDTLRPEVVERFFAQMRAELYNLYGPTEATVDATFWRCGPGSRKRSVPIGRPLQNVQAYVLDRNLQPVPIGVQGELCLGGAGLARGYCGHPEFTAERFIPHPFHDDPGARLYKTGDLASYLPDGSIQFLGRIDRQVKIRGNRVELGEIEAVLRRHSGVRDVVVVARDDEATEPSSAVRSGKSLVAYVVPAGGAEPSVSELLDFVREKVPAYMQPAAFVMLGRLPLSANGKVDLSALPPPSGGRPELAEELVPARTLVEETISLAWADLLEVEQVGVHDNFFDLGGHSLLATQVISRLHRAFGVQLPLRVVFESPTVAGLADAIERATGASGAPNAG